MFGTPSEDDRLAAEEVELLAIAAAEERTRLEAERTHLEGECAWLDAELKRVLDAQRAHDEQRNALEAATIASLHAQAVTDINIRSLVPVVLDSETPNYTKWRGHFLLVLGKYELSEHVLADATYPDNSSWVRMECTALGWLYDTIIAYLVEVVMQLDASARRVWLAFEEQFIGNKETRALYLDAEFRNFNQGDISIADFYRKMKSMADALGDLGETIHDRTLVLNILRGLNDKFSYMVPMIKRAKPFSSFLEVRSDLMIKELTMRHNNSSSSSTAFLASGSPSGGVTSGARLDLSKVAPPTTVTAKGLFVDYDHSLLLCTYL